MENNIFIGPLGRPLPWEHGVEVVERKGSGHPDTLCDYISEGISRALSGYYLSEFGCVMHHNVDKALLVGGISEPAFGGGRVVKPIEVIVAGRAVKDLGGKPLPVDEISAEAARGVIAKAVRHLDPVSGVKVTIMIRPGSRDLADLFRRF
ncbi:MAG: S-adenosylmethionine synthase, partial [Candidatus Dadabacteria bacterium]|nr:S-adenosylmethionine synthase [Candidatus Dadabacteria bacterium]